MTPPSLRKLAQVAYVFGLLAVVSAGALNMATPVVVDAKLNGVEFGAERPQFSFYAFRKELYQRDWTAWFEQHWGLRGYAVKTDNTIVYSLFREARSGFAIVGNQGVLLSEDDLAYVNRSDKPDEAIAMAKLIARVQQKARRRGKVLIPVLMPAKTSFLRSAVPAGWHRRGAFEKSDLNIYGAFVDTLKESGAVFVDGRKLLANEGLAPNALFAPTGRHWRMSAGCRVLQSVLDAARPELPELGADQIDCHTHIDPYASIDVEDYDLYRLLNLWLPPPAAINVEVLDGAKASAALRIPTVFVGSSFVWKFVHISHELEVLRPSLYYYYDKGVVDSATLQVTKKTIEPFTDGWRDDTFGKRLFVLGILETYLPDDGQKFLKEIEEEVDSAGP